MKVVVRKVDVYVGGAEPPDAPRRTPRPSWTWLWRIGRDQPAWLFGVMHSPDPRVRPPRVAREALDAAESFVAEAVIDDPAGIVRHYERSDGTLLESDLPPRLWRRVRRLLSPRRAAAFRRLKAWAAGLALASMSRPDDDGPARPGDGFPAEDIMDARLMARARRLGKETWALETISDQAAAFDSISLEDQVDFVRRACRRLEGGGRGGGSGKDAAEDAVEAYLSADADKVRRGFRRANAGFNEALFGRRNERMAAKIEEALRSRPGTSFFFAVGAGHLVGRGSIVRLLRERGFDVERVRR